MPVDGYACVLPGYYAGELPLIFCIGFFLFLSFPLPFRPDKLEADATIEVSGLGPLVPVCVKEEFCFI